METIVLRGPKYRRRVEIQTIEYCISDGNYTYVYLKGERPMLIAKTLLRFAELLPNFIRIHKGTLVNPAHIVGHQLQKGNVQVYLSNNRSLAVSRRRVIGFRQHLFASVA